MLTLLTAELHILYKVVRHHRVMHRHFFIQQKLQYILTGGDTGAAAVADGAVGFRDSCQTKLESNSIDLFPCTATSCSFTDNSLPNISCSVKVNLCQHLCKCCMDRVQPKCQTRSDKSASRLSEQPLRGWLIKRPKCNEAGIACWG